MDRVAVAETQRPAERDRRSGAPVRDAPSFEQLPVDPAGHIEDRPKHRPERGRRVGDRVEAVGQRPVEHPPARAALQLGELGDDVIGEPVGFPQPLPHPSRQLEVDSVW